MGGDQRSKALETHAGMVLAAVDQTPDITIGGLCVLLAKYDVTASHGAVWNLLARYGLTVKKKTAHASEQERSDVAAAREI
jgi:transposase